MKTIFYTYKPQLKSLSSFIKGLSVLIFISCLVNCSPISLTNPHAQSIDPALLPEGSDKETMYQKPAKKTDLELAITDLILNDNTDLGRSFSDLYLASFPKNSSLSTAYLSLEDFMYDHNKNHIPISPETNKEDTALRICIVSGRIINQNLQIEDSKKCKDFPVSRLSGITNKGYDFTLENTAKKTPKLKLILHPRST